MRVWSLASGNNVAPFTIASNDFDSENKDKAEYHAVVRGIDVQFVVPTVVGRLLLYSEPHNPAEGCGRRAAGRKSLDVDHGESMDDKKLQEMFRRAAEIASVAPESMHQAAFNRALDTLMDTSQPSPPRAPSGGGTKGAPTRDAAKPTNVKDRVAALKEMDRALAHEVDHADGALDKALALLLVAGRELGIDGLTSPEMAAVLTDKFRWRVSRQAINQALDSAGNKVDRTKDGRVSRWRIMQAGETWLSTPAQGRQNNSPARTNPGTRRGKKTKRPTSAEGMAGAETKGITTKAGKSSSNRRVSLGPKGAVERLIDAGWFGTPRSLSDIRVELEHQQALRYKATDLSPAMTRLLREGRLKRTKTEAGQYEYRA